MCNVCVRALDRGDAHKDPLLAEKLLAVDSCS